MTQGCAGIDSDRLATSTDGAVAAIVTIILPDLKPPGGTNAVGLPRLWPLLPSDVAIDWNHHHLARLIPDVAGGILWINFDLLSWLSLVPFATAWIGERGTAPLPAAVYEAVLPGCAVSWLLPPVMAIRAQGPGSRPRRALNYDREGKLSFVLSALAIPASFLSALLADGCYAVVAAIWPVPDRRLETHLRNGGAS